MFFVGGGAAGAVHAVVIRGHFVPHWLTAVVRDLIPQLAVGLLADSSEGKTD